MDELLNAISKALERKGLSASAASELAVGNPSAIKNLMKRRTSSGDTARNHPIENLAAVAEVLGLELYLGPPRPQPSMEVRSGHETLALINEFAFVDRFDVKLSAGPGSNGDNARKLAAVAFRKDWLIERGLKPECCVVCSVGGNSMEPLLYEGDLVLLDRHRKELRNGLVYGITDIEGDVRIKRVERVDQGIILRSDNPDCPSELRLGEDANRVKIIGALAWSGHNHNTLKHLSRRSQEPPTFEHEWI
jgi:phage repressor protein C with HTH and peptisase S24 domain